jgi:hypothetical protein
MDTVDPVLFVAAVKYMFAVAIEFDVAHTLWMWTVARL